MEQTQNLHHYLVGGYVRDHLLELEPHDRDYVVMGETSSSMLSRGFIQVGKDFPVFLHPETRDEYALARTEKKNGQGSSAFDCDLDNVSLEEDLARRDLTINAMALMSDQSIIDPFDGQSDLKKRCLRHTTKAFAEDPLRVLRVARFLARFGPTWHIHPETERLMRTIRDSGELTHLSADRIWKETHKALQEPYAHLYFETLKGFGVFPELESMIGIPQPPNHHPEGDVFTHALLSLERAVSLDHDTPTRFSALFHDIGKPESYKCNGNLHGHEKTGVPLLIALCERLPVPKKYKELAIITCEYHTHCHRIAEMKANRLFHFLVRGTDALRKPERFKQFIDACQCDAQGRGVTHRERPYPQRNIANTYLTALSGVDREGIVKKAMADGVKGVEIGLRIEMAYRRALRNVSMSSQR